MSDALYNGVKVLGYTGKESEKYQINPETAPIVKIIFDQYADGVPMQKICQSLKAQGMKSNNGNDFTINSLRRILTNSAYIGVYKWGEHTIPDGMPRIIDDDLFERVQRRLEKNKHGGKGAAKLVSDAEIADYWLTGHIYCGLCGETMQGISGTSKRGDKFHYYSCKGHRKHVCSMKNQRKDLLEKIVLHVLNEVVQNPANRLQIAEKCYAYYMSQNADSGVYEASIKSQLRETDAKIKNLLKAIEAGVLTETTAERMKALESTKHRLEDALIAEQNRQKYQLKLEDIVKWLESFVGDLSDMHTRKEILDDYIGKILVYEDKLVVTFKYLDKQQSFKYAETSAMIDNCQAILDLFERKEYSGHVSEEMLASVMDESENPYFF